jgi:hypothetical protein
VILVLDLPISPIAFISSHRKEGHTIVDNKTAEIIQETRKLQIMHRGKKVVSVMSLLLLLLSPLFPAFMVP